MEVDLNSTYATFTTLCVKLQRWIYCAFSLLHATLCEQVVPSVWNLIFGEVVVMVTYCLKYRAVHCNQILRLLNDIFFDLLARYQDLNGQYKEAAHTVTEQKELITQLECDLLSVNALPTAYRGQGEVCTL